MPLLLRALRALRHRDYRRFFCGHGVSLVGTWMQRVAFAWLAYRLTGSAAVLGLMVFLGQLPTLVAAPWAGVLLDRCDRRRVVILTQTAAMLQALGLAALTLAPAVQVWHLALLAGVLGTIEAFDLPARQALIPALVGEPEDLGNAIALNAFLVNGARLVGPLVAGMVIAAFGEAVCFLVNAVSFAAVIVALLGVKPARPAIQDRRASVTTDLRAGLAYAWRERSIRALIGLVAVVSLLGVAYVVLLPVLAREALAGDAHTLGLLSAGGGAGALAGAVYLALRPRIAGLMGVVGSAAAIVGLGLAVLGLVTDVGQGMLVMGVVGCGVMVCTAGATTLLHTLAAEEKRGRVMSLYATAFVGMVPLGSLFAGWLASSVGTTRTLLVCGAACVLGAAAFLVVLLLPRPSGELLSAAPLGPCASEPGTRASPSA
jgi:MFS family permease